MHRVLSIQDISCVGKCSLTVALPVISALGIECVIMPTAVLSTHTGFNNFTFCDLTDEIDKISSVWQKESISFSGICTGFLGSFIQLELVAGLFDKFGDGLILVDPCMGDNGKLYSVFDENFAAAMAGLCKHADVITPNLTEACYLTKTPYPYIGYDEFFIDELLHKLASLGVKKIVLKGISYSDDECSVISYDVKTECKNTYTHELLPHKVSGTGDMFAAIVFSLLVRGFDIDFAVKTAADFIVICIKTTLNRENRSWYGVDFESNLSILTQI